MAARIRLGRYNVGAGESAFGIGVTGPYRPAEKSLAFEVATLFSVCWAATTGCEIAGKNRTNNKMIGYKKLFLSLVVAGNISRIMLLPR